jgi:cysteine desulfurase / selenocysteine lyase
MVRSTPFWVGYRSLAFAITVDRLKLPDFVPDPRQTPQGLGVLVVRARVADRLRPVLVGWKSVDAQDYRLSDRLRTGARRYEPGSLNAIGLVGLHASLGLLLQNGLDAVYSRITALRTYAQSRLIEAGCHLYGCSGSGIVALSAPLRPSRSVVEYLAERGILVSARRSPDDLDVVRIAPHFYNSECDLDRLATALAGGVAPVNVLMTPRASVRAGRR